MKSNKDQRTGVKPKDRKLATTVRKEAKAGKLTANQWQNTPQQNEFMAAWLDPKSDTFGNAYKSALKAKYSPKYANQIIANVTDNEWIRSYKRRSSLQMEHLEAKLNHLINTTPNSKSPDDTVIKAIELTARLKGLLNTNTQVNVAVVQPILSGNSVHRVEQ